MAFALNVTPAAGAGTVAITTAGVVTGTGTAFTSADVNKTLIIGQWAARISSFTSSTSITLDRGPNISVSGQAYSLSLNGSRLVQTGTDTNLSNMFNGTNGVTRLIAGEWTRYEVPHQVQISGTLTQPHNEQWVQLQRTGSAYDTSQQIVVQNNGRWIWGGTITAGGLTKYRETIPMLFGQSVQTSYGENSTMQINVNTGGTLEWYNTTVRGSAQSIWTNGTLIFRDVVFDRQGLVNNANDSQFRISNGATLDIDGLTIIGGKFFILTSVTNANFVKFSGYKPTQMLRGIGYQGVLNSFTITDGTVNTTTSGRLRLDDFAGEGNTRDYGVWANGLIDFYNPKSGCGITMGAHNGLSSFDTGFARIYSSVSIVHKNIFGSALQNIVTYVADNATNAQSPYNTKRKYAWVSDANGVNGGDILIGYRYLPPNTADVNVNPIRRSVNQTDDVFVFHNGGYEILPFSTQINMEGVGVKNTSYSETLDTNVTLSRANAIAKLASSFTINPITKVVTVTANSSFDDVYDITKVYKFDGTVSSFEVPSETSPISLIVSANGSNLTAFTGWSLVVNTGVTLSEGVKFKKVKFDTITLNGTGKITGVYESLAGISTIWEFQSVQPNTSIAIYDSTGTVLYYNAVTTLGNYRYYIAPGTTGAYTYAIEKYGTRREEGTFPANAGGILFYVPRYADDFGISEPTLATVLAYTSIDTLDKLYDYTAVYRLSQAGIVKGQIATRAGTAVDLGSFGLVVNNSPAGGALYSVTGTTITVKSNILSNGVKYTLATSTATIVPNTTEIIAADIEDANGDSSVNILGGSGNFTLWKIPNATPEDNFATGTNLGNFTNQKIRFVSAPGFKIVIRDNTTGFRQVISMDKGVYEAGMFFGSQIQLAQANDIPIILDKMNQSLLEHIIINNGIKKSSLIIQHTTSL